MVFKKEAPSLVGRMKRNLMISALVLAWTLWMAAAAADSRCEAEPLAMLQMWETGQGWESLLPNWVAVKALNLSSYIGETMFTTIYLLINVT